MTSEIYSKTPQLVLGCLDHSSSPTARDILSCYSSLFGAAKNLNSDLVNNKQTVLKHIFDMIGYQQVIASFLSFTSVWLLNDYELRVFQTVEGPYTTRLSHVAP